MEEKKIGFFKKVKMAIFNIDEYSKFAQEKGSRTAGYFFKIVVLITFLMTLLITYQGYKVTKNALVNFITEVPDFQIKDGILTIEDNKKYQYVDEDNTITIIVDPTTETIPEIKTKEAIIFLKDKICVFSSLELSQIKYSDIIKTPLQKRDIENVFIVKILRILFIIFGIIIAFTYIIASIFVIIFDVLILSLIGFIVNLIAKTKLKYKDVFKMSLYAMTLPIILMVIYQIVTLFTTFTMEYFNIVYRVISYIYIITAILMIKSEIVKNQQMVGEVISENKEIEKPIEAPKKEEKKKEKKEEKKEEKKNKENPGGGQPEQSKA